MSAPSLHAVCLELLRPGLQQLPLPRAAKNQQPEQQLRVLDAGCGTGYITAALGLLVQGRGKVHPPTPYTWSRHGQDKCALLPVCTQVLGVDKAERMVQLARWSLCVSAPELLDPGQGHTVELVHANVLKGML